MEKIYQHGNCQFKVIGISLQKKKKIWILILQLNASLSDYRFLLFSYLKTTSSIV